MTRFNAGLSGTIQQLRGNLGFASIISLAVTVVLSVALLPGSARAQLGPVDGATATPIPGAGHDYLQDLVDTVNPSDGSVSVRIKAPVPSGRGIKVPFSFNYDSNGVWQPTSNGNGVVVAASNLHFMSLGGWTYGIPRLDLTQIVTQNPTQHNSPCIILTSYAFQDVNGTRHSINTASAGGGTGCPQTVNGGGDDQIQAFSQGITVGGLFLSDADGTVYKYGAAGCPPPSGAGSGNAALPTSIEDRNGNVANFTTSCTNQTISVQDALSRTSISSSGFGSTGNTVTISGLQQPYTLTWGTAQANVSVGNKLVNSPDAGCGFSFGLPSGTATSAITAIQLPDSQSFSFGFDSTYGLLNRIVYPSGASVAYAWENNPLSAYMQIPPNSQSGTTFPICEYQYDTFAVAHRYLYNTSGTLVQQQDFSYAPTTWNSAGTAWTSKQTTVTTTDKVSGLVSKTVYTYVPFALSLPPYVAYEPAPQLPLEQTVVYQDGSGNTLKTVNKTWFDPFELKSEQDTLPVAGGGSVTSETDYTYGPGAQVTEKDEYDFGTSGRGSLLRKTLTTYQSFSSIPTFPSGGTTAPIFDRPCQVIAQDGNGNPFAETDTFYDSGSTSTVCGTAGTPSVTGVSNLTGHDETNYSSSSTTPRGNATTVIRKCFQGSTACSGGNPTYASTYDETGQRLSETDPNGNVTGYSYADSFKSTNTGSFTTTAGSPPSGEVTNAYLTKITYPTTGSTSHVENFTYGYNDGELTTSVDENSQTTTYRYNDNFDRPTETDYPDSGNTTISYNDAGASPSVSTTKLISASPSVNLSTTAVTDGMGHVVQTQVTTDPDGTTFTAKTYDGQGKVFQSYNPTRCSPPTTNCGKETTWGLTTYTYDALGRTTNVAEPDGSAVQTSYSGNQTTVTDEVGNQRTNQTDGLGRLTAVMEAPNVSGFKFQTTYTYDPLNDLTGVTQNGSNSSNARVRNFVYDSLGRLTSAQNPESGTITYTYDLNGNVATRAEPKANQTGTAVTNSAYTYDALNRLLTKLHNDPVDANSFYAYDGTTLTGCTGPTPPAITSPTNLIGRRSAMCSGNSASSFSYDTMGRTLFEKRNNKGTSTAVNTVGYTYYLDGSLSTLTYPSGDVVTYTVGGAERVTQVSDSANSYVGFSGSPATYAPNGALAGMTQGHTSSFAGIVTSNLYNDRLQPILLSAGVSSGSIFSLCYDFHLHQAISSTPCSFSSYTTGDNGNVFQVINNNDTTRSAAYIYDSLNRIAQAYTLNETSANCWGETYSSTATAPGVLPPASNLGIDAWGNLTNRSAVSGMGSNCHTEGLTSTANTKNQLSVLTYDAAGNVNNDGNGNQPAYDAENRIITDQGFSYFYDADSVRMEKSSSSTGTMYWPGPSGEYLTESDLTGAINEEYIYFNGERIARVDRPSGAVHYYFSDHLQSASVITDSSGNPTETYYYYPYGGIAFSSGSDPNHYKFTGKERDTESGLDEFGARYYTSAFGRFMTPDWETKPTDVPYANFGNPQSLNLYSYVQNNPTTVGDPDGHVGPDVGADIAEEIATYIATHPEEVQAVEAEAAAGAGVARWGLLAGPALYVGEMINPHTTVGGDKPQAQQEQHEQQSEEPQASSDGARQGNGRGGKQSRLNQLANDDKVSSADRGWIKQEQNAIKSGKRDTVRVPPGKELAHVRGREAAKGYSHTESPSSLQNIRNHRTQHKYDSNGTKNKKKNQ